MNSNASGCLIPIGILLGLVFWQVSLVLIAVATIVAFIVYLQNRGYTEEAGKWNNLHSGCPCFYSGRYGFVDSVYVKERTITLYIKPIKALLPNTSEDSEVFTGTIKDGSFRNGMCQLLEHYSISKLEGVSVELSAIESALKCQEQLAWCVESMNELVKMSDEIDRALSLAPGNPLLEPSISAMESAKARITDESFRINEAKDFSLDTLKNLIDYLSVPEKLRQISAINDLQDMISARNNDLRSSFNELLEFNRAYAQLID